MIIISQLSSSLRLGAVLGAASTSALQWLLRQSHHAAHGPPLSYEETYIDHKTLTAVDPPMAAVKDAKGRGPLTAVFLHGLLGSGKNWRSFSKGLAVQAAKREHRDVRSILVDLRAHGASAALDGLHPPHTIESAGGDVVRTLNTVLGGAPHVLIGLSLGGKVALDVLHQLHQHLLHPHHPHHKHFASQPQQQQQQQQQSHGQQQEQQLAPAASENDDQSESDELPPPGAGSRILPLQCWVLDSQPGMVSRENDTPTSVSRILSFVSRMQMPVASRQELVRALDREGLPRSISWWLSSGLVPVSPANPSGPLRWGFDEAGSAALYHSYCLSSYWHALERPPPGVTLHVVRGERSDRWTPEMLARLEAARAAWQAAEVHEGERRVGQLRLHVLPDAGHWLQADNPLGLQAMMLPWFRDEPGV